MDALDLAVMVPDISDVLFAAEDLKDMIKDGFNLFSRPSNNLTDEIFGHVNSVTSKFALGMEGIKRLVLSGAASITGGFALFSWSLSCFFRSLTGTNNCSYFIS